MGMNHSGEIDYLTRLASPDVTVINNAGSAHIANLGSLEAIAQAKGEILAGLSKQGIAIINADDYFAPMWRVLAGSHPVIDFAMQAKAAVRASTSEADYMQLIAVETPLGKFKANLQVPGVHNAFNALAATAAAIALKVKPAMIAAGLENFSGVAGRLQRRMTSLGAVVIDDSYNANPASLRAAIQVLVKAEGKKFLVLGDMGELGIEAAKMHAEMGAEARDMGVDKMFALGELSSYAVKEFGANAQHFDSVEALVDALKLELISNCTVLVKGSRFMKMERVVKNLVGDEAAASKTANTQH